MNPPFRAEHIGSLVRPPELLRARQEHAAGKLNRDGPTAIETTPSATSLGAAGGCRPSGRHRRRVPARHLFRQPPVPALPGCRSK